MINFIYTIPNYFLLTIIITTVTVPALLATYLIRHHAPFSIRAEGGNEAIAGLSATIGIIYAILVGFTVMHGIDNLKKANDLLLDEAKAVTNIYNDAKVLSPPPRTAIKKELISYLNLAIKYEWPLMSAGKEEQIKYNVITAISSIDAIMQTITPKNYLQKIALRDMYKDLEILSNVRLERMSMAEAAIPKDLWTTLIIGSILTLASCLFFKLDLRLHLTLVIGVATMIATALFLIVALDHPFRGEFSVSPDELTTTLHIISNSST